MIRSQGKYLKNSYKKGTRTAKGSAGRRRSVRSPWTIRLPTSRAGQRDGGSASRYAGGKVKAVRRLRVHTSSQDMHNWQAFQDDQPTRAQAAAGTKSHTFTSEVEW
uniref:Uncharacterized protein n=1 Tax=Hyaloperonospora arabidopsidis (strain Emoy2) TaxID=559515 RepID=M4BW06_HYAAE